METLVHSLEALQLNDSTSTLIPTITQPKPTINVYQIVQTLVSENKKLKDEIQRLQTLIINQKVFIPNWVH